MHRLDRLIAGVVAIGVVLLCAGLFVLPLHQPTPQQLLGMPLPLSAAHLNLELHHRFVGEYTGYLRFDLASQDIAALLADPAFQPPMTSANPLAGISTAARGQISLATIVQGEQPAWWNPSLGRPYLLAYRSRSGPNSVYTGPDAAWYMIDTSNPTRATVFVYIVEV